MLLELVYPTFFPYAIKVALIPEIEVYDLLAKEGQIEATCEFCGRVWHLDRADVEKLFSTGE